MNLLEEWVEQEQIEKQKIIDTTKKIVELSLPSYSFELIIKKSSIPNAGLGVFSLSFIPKNLVLDKYEGTFTKEKPNDTTYTWMIYPYDEDGLPNSSDPTNFVGCIDSKNGDHWTKYVNGSAQEGDNNIEAAQGNQNIYYNSVKDITPGEELFVWYGEKYNQSFSIY